MTILVKALHMMLIWLTAATTLLAGTPHFDCLCPNGNRKPFCLGFAAQGSGCCCGGSCCQASAGPSCCERADRGEQAEESCCHQEPTARESSTGSRVDGPCCKKALAPAGAVALTPTKATADQNGTERLAAVSIMGTPVNPDVTAAPGAFAWYSYQLPPPTDLVIAFRHFVI